jgi:chloride channel protein, CIC family
MNSNVSRKSYLRLKLRQMEEGLTFVELLSIFVGVIGGLGAVGFRLLISLNQTLFFSDLLSRVSYSLGGVNVGIILLPAIGGLIVGPLVTKFAPEARGHGVPEVMEAYTLHEGRIRSRVAIVKVLASSITLGSGGSAGREGPIAQIGATAGSSIGRLLQLDSAEIRLLVICGLSSGIAGTFNAPLGGALFGMEVLQGRFSWKGTVPIILSSVVGAAVANIAFGLSPTIVAPVFHFLSATELILYFVVGLVFGILSYIWVRVFYFFEDLFSGFKLSWKYKAAIGGILTGAVGMFFPKYGILGVGYNGVDLELAGGITITMLVILGVAKILATSLTVGSGNSGGIFSPSLYIGSMFGGAMGIMFVHLFPGTATQPFAYSLAGMGAMFAGAARAPMTSMIMIPEMTNNWSLLPPLMVSCITSFYISSYLLKKSSIYTLKLERRGVDIKNLAIPDELETVKVEEVMQTKVITVSQEDLVSEFIKFPAIYGHTAYPVMADGKLAGMVNYEKALNVPPDKQNSTKVKDIMSKSPVFTFTGESVRQALKKMQEGSITKIPVVDRKNVEKLVGILTERDIVNAHEISLRRVREEA